LRTESAWQIFGDSKFLRYDKCAGLIVCDMAQGILADIESLKRHFSSLSL